MFLAKTIPPNILRKKGNLSDFFVTSPEFSEGCEVENYPFCCYTLTDIREAFEPLSVSIPIPVVFSG